MSRTICTPLSVPLCLRIPNCERDCQAKVSSLQSAMKFQFYAFFLWQTYSRHWKKNYFRCDANVVWLEKPGTSIFRAKYGGRRFLTKVVMSIHLPDHTTSRLRTQWYSQFRRWQTNTLRFSLRLIHPYSTVASEPTAVRVPILLNETKFVRTLR